MTGPPYPVSASAMTGTFRSKLASIAAFRTMSSAVARPRSGMPRVEIAVPAPVMYSVSKPFWRHTRALMSAVNASWSESVASNRAHPRPSYTPGETMVRSSLSMARKRAAALRGVFVFAMVNVDEIEQIAV